MEWCRETYKDVTSRPRWSARLRPTLLVMLVLLFAGSAGAAEPIIGRASVIDGDTIEIGGQRIRLHGIDAPESAQQCQDSRARSYACGRIAAQKLDELLAASRPTRCVEKDRDRYGRIVATCFRADGKDSGALMVRGGHALDWPRYSQGAYAAAQEEAKAARAGVWQGEFTPPWDWRTKPR